MHRYLFHILLTATLTFLLIQPSHSASADPHVPAKAFFGNVIQYFHLDYPIFIVTMGSKIAFSSDRDGNVFVKGQFAWHDGNSEIYEMNDDGSEQTRLTSNKKLDKEPSWAPDGDSITFSSYRDNNWEIYTLKDIELNGLNSGSEYSTDTTQSNEKRLTSNSWHDSSPAWAPEGDLIAFTSSPGANHEIHVIKTNKTGLKNLTNEPTAADSHSSWGPLGEIVFDSDREGNFEIFRMDSQYASGQTNLTENNSLDYYPDWSKDGTKIAFTSERDNNQEIYVMNLTKDEEGTYVIDDIFRVTDNPAIDKDPSWSPDGNWIAFTSQRSGNWDIWKIKAKPINDNDEEAINLTNNPAVELGPDWSPSETVSSVRILGRLKIATNPEVLLLITDDTVISGPEPVGGQALANGQRVAVVSNEPPPIGLDLPDEDLATALQVTVIPKEAQGHHRTCTVVEQLGSSINLACNNGDLLELPNSELPLGASTVVLVQPDKPPELIATATSLHERMERFKFLANAQGDANLSSELDVYQQQVGAGFDDGFQQTKAGASPEVLKFLETAEGLDDKVADLAEWFLSTGAPVIADTRDVLLLADLLEEFAGSYGAIIDMLVNETLMDMPAGELEAARAEIHGQSGSFVNAMKSDLMKAANLLRTDELEEAISVLDEATENEEEWEQSIAIPTLSLILADEAIQTAEQELSQYGDILSDEAKDKLQASITVLKNAKGASTGGLGPLIDDLWAVMDAVWDQQNGGATEGTTIEQAQKLLDTARSDLEAYSEYMVDDVKANIQEKIMSLQAEVDSGGDSQMQRAVDELAVALNWYEGPSEGGAKEEAQELITTAKLELEDYSEYMLDDVKNNIQEKLIALQAEVDSGGDSQMQGAMDELAVALQWQEGQSESGTAAESQKLLDQAESELQEYSDYMSEDVKNDIRQKALTLEAAIGSGDNALIQDAMNDLAAALAKSGSSENGDHDQSGDLTSEAEKAMAIAQDTLHNYSDDLDQGVVAELQLMISQLQGALGTGDHDQISSAFEALSSVLGPLQGFTPLIQLSIEIECPSQMMVEHIFKCSSTHNIVPDQITWTAQDGVPSTGSENWFQTSFSSTGSFSISIEACVDSICASDVQVITVIPEPTTTSDALPEHGDE